jgi:hypothetical protein
MQCDEGGVACLMKGADMKPKPYHRHGHEIDFNGSQENWDYISKSIVKHMMNNEEKLAQAKANYEESLDVENRVVESLGSMDRTEQLFYKLHLMIEYGFDEEKSEKQSAIICFQRNPPKTFHGIFNRSLKVDGRLINTKNAVYLFEEVNDNSLIWSGGVWVTIYYLQDFTFFVIHYFYDVVENHLTKKKKRPTITVIEAGKVMKMLKSKNLLNRFKKEHRIVYAEYLANK